MGLINLIFLFFLSANSSIIELGSVKDLDNLRYSTDDGKISYYQTRSGSLILSKNYKNQTLLEKELGTQFLVSATASKRYVLIEEDIHFHDQIGIKKNNNIYSARFGAKNVKKQGKGISAKLHLSDSWLSYFDMLGKTIYIKAIDGESHPISIELNNPHNPFFIPAVHMLSEDIILYTDINSRGVMGLMKYERSKKKSFALYKSDQVGTKIELCQMGNRLYLGEFSYPTLKKGSQIYKISIDKNKILNSKTLLYESSHSDIGHLLCSQNDSSLYFVKKVDDSVTELARVNIKNSKLEILSNLKSVGHILKMDSKLLIPFRDKFYTLTQRIKKK